MPPDWQCNWLINSLTKTGESVRTESFLPPEQTRYRQALVENFESAVVSSLCFINHRRMRVYS